MHYVTIIADASFDLSVRAGGWACWIKSDLVPGSRTYDAEFKSLLDNSGVAELAALANALTVAIEMKLVTEKSIVMLQSDSEQALAIIRSLKGVKETVKKGNRPMLHPPAKPGSATARRILDRIEEARRKGRFQLMVRHVRGHVKEGKSSNWVNNDCDARARRRMQDMRRRLNGEILQAPPRHENRKRANTPETGINGKSEDGGARSETEGRADENRVPLEEYGS